MIDVNSSTVIPEIQLTQDDDRAELHIKLGALDLRVQLAMREFLCLMTGSRIYPKAMFRPVIGMPTKDLKSMNDTVTLDADTLGMPTWQDGRRVEASER